MKYNTTREKLVMPEYGRNIQQMVDYLRTIEDPVKRQKNAKAIIELMGVLNPHLKNVEDFRHKLWDHLYLIADFDLDVESPYPTPTREKIFKRPEPLSYPSKQRRKQRHLGKNLTAVIDKALAEKDEEKRKGFTQSIAYYMKLAYTNWHKEPVHDDMIREELSEMTNGELTLGDGNIKIRFDNNNNRNNNNKKNAGGQNRNNNNRAQASGNNNSRNSNNPNNRNPNNPNNRNPNNPNNRNNNNNNKNRKPRPNM
ncbi:DUF4290 domain-containing protein [Taibaiella lutea]|uniref:DUF4290 domain-containing protein n=1 Tax=Taibaiella lutea TaxID=2608001 RepID=A0A5M6CFR7_9BACT|nr:DUF4290 domain-containing protein [Taibaiella lutea]KAA5533803.1 DUF4290 domain-containing protein [Taibaiella lutea]